MHLPIQKFASGRIKKSMKGQVKKSMALILVLAFLLLFGMSCSSVNHFLSWTGIRDSQKDWTRPTDKERARFPSQVRPYRGNPDSHYLLACYYRERGRYREAIAELEKVLQIDSDNAMAYHSLGITYDLLGESPKAVEYYQMALRLVPRQEDVLKTSGIPICFRGGWMRPSLLSRRPCHSTGGAEYFTTTWV